MMRLFLLEGLFIFIVILNILNPYFIDISRSQVSLIEETTTYEDLLNPFNSINGPVSTGSEMINLTWEESFIYGNTSDKKPFTIEKNVTEIVKAIDSFLPNGTELNQVQNVTANYLEVWLVNLTVFQDHDNGPGEVYIETNINYNTTYDDNNGLYYMADDSNGPDFFDLNNNVVFSGFINGEWTIDIHVKESDSGKTVFDSLGNVTLNNFPRNGSYNGYTSNNDAIIAFEWCFYEYWGGSSWYWQIEPQDYAELYRAYLWEDFGDAGFEPEALYYRLIRGYDPSLGDNATCIQYLYYWSEERDNFGNDLGHYYDFSPVFIYITEFGETPYRIVYQDNNPGTTALPARLQIYSIFELDSVENFIAANVSDDLLPFLGEIAIIEYDTHPISEFWSRIDRWKPAHYSFPSIKKPVLIITDSYHNFQIWDNYIQINEYVDDLVPVEMNISLIRYWYSLLDESFNATLKDYSWNNYEVPENLSLTIDMLKDPFEHPYIVDCYENITHQNRYARVGKQSSLEYDANITVTVKIPLNLTFTYPTLVEPGKERMIEISMSTVQDQIYFIIDHSIDCNLSLNAWFLHLDKSFEFEGKTEFSFSLEEIKFWRDLLELDGLINEKLEEIDWYITFNYLYFNPQLLGVIVNGSINIHLWDIFSEILGTIYPPSTIVLEIMSFFINDITLQMDFSVISFLNASILSTHGDMQFTSDQDIYFDDYQQVEYVSFLVTANPTDLTPIQLILTNINYGMKLIVNWSMNFDFSSLLNNIFDVSDISIFLGTYPNVSAVLMSEEPSIELQEIIIYTPPNPTDTSTIPSSSKTSEQEQATNFTILGVLPLLVVVFIRSQMKKRK